MPLDFDPYHRWLGIPPDEQPADHYRMLGLVRFESDIEVIRDAVERQIAHVRRYGLGKHSDLSQRILNELATAKACLLDPEDKSQYDAQLRKKAKASTPAPAVHSAAEPPQPPVVPEPPTPQPVEPPRVPETMPAAERAERPKRAARPADSGGALKWLMIGGAGATGLALVAWLVWMMVPRGPKPGAGVVLMPQVQRDSARPPKLARIADQSTDEGRPLMVPAMVTDRGSAPGPLLFGLVQAPPGAKIDVESGVFTWTPTADQARMKHAVTVQVVARDASELADKISFVVDVREVVLLRPTLQMIPQMTLAAGSKREFPASARDPNRPPRKLTYALRRAPSWVRIDEASGTITVETPEDDKGGFYPVQVRVASDAPNAPFAETSFTVVVTAQPQTPGVSPGMPPAEDLSGLGEIKGLSGSLNPLQMDVRQTAIGAAQDLMYRLGADSKVMPLFAGGFGGPVAAVCELNKANKLDGVVVSFHPGKDPMTALNAGMKSILDKMPRPTLRPMPSSTGSSRRIGQAAPRPPDEEDSTSDGFEFNGLSSTQIARVREQAAQGCWADVQLNTYLDFKQGDRLGVVAIWDADGQRVYWGNYKRGKRHGFCCVFKNNRPRIVAVFDEGEPGPVYLVSKNRVEKRFDGQEEAKGDAIAQDLLAELDRIESQLKQDERLLEKQIKTSVQYILGHRLEWQRCMERMRRSGREARQKQALQESMKASGRQ
jgi:hypothetical protein